MSLKDTPQRGESTSASSLATITFFPSREKAKGTRKPLTSWMKLFTMFASAKPPTTDKKNDQPGWSPAVFTGDLRKGECVEAVFALVFDFDAGTTTPEEALAVWKGHLACVYTSWSHTPEKPKFRLIVVLSRGVSAEEYTRCWKTGASRITAAGQAIDVATKDPSRLWYLPCRRNDSFRVLIQNGEALDVEGLLAQAADPPASAAAVTSTTAKPDGIGDRDTFLKAVKERSRLEDIIQPPGGWERRSDDDWWCSSPLRPGDTTPSFHISISNQVWHDFGLAEGGDVIAYLQRLWGCGFKEALNRRARELGIRRKQFEPKDGDGIALDEHDDEPGSNNSGEPKRTPCTDLGNAERLIRRHGQDIRYCPTWDKWLVWNRTRWCIDNKKQVERFAQLTVRSIYAEARDESDPDRRKALADHAKKSEANARKVAMIEQAKSLPGIAVTPEDLDADPYLFNVQNGTLDLRTGELRPHRREDLLTMIANANYDPKATCPLYDRFLEQVQPDPEIRELLWKLDGASLAGVIRDHLLPIHFGNGRNGKSVKMNAVLHVFGDYGRQVPTELLMAKRGESHPTERTTLFRVRLAAAAETEEGKALNVAFVKQMTGGDPITARRMREDFWTFMPTHKLQLATNHQPVIRETKDAIWARVLLILWGVQIPPEQQDKQLGEKLKTEADGILAKLVRHCIEWQRAGLTIPDSVKATTRSYREDMDSFGDFLDGHCVVDKDATDSAKNLFEAFERWAEENNEYEISQTRFGRQLADRGFKKERCSKTGRVLWRGLRVRGDADSSGNAMNVAVHEPGAGMALDGENIGEILDQLTRAEQSEQSDRETGMNSREGEILGRTRNSDQTIRTIQAGSPQPAIIHDIITGTAFDVSTPEGEEAYREHLLSLV